MKTYFMVTYLLLVRKTHIRFSFLFRVLQHYEHVMLPVWMCNCDQPDDYGVAQYCIPALVYIAQDNYTHKGTTMVRYNGYNSDLHSNEIGG